jgi:hypothetical protein
MLCPGIVALDGRLTTAEGDILLLDGRVTTLEGDVATLQGDVTTLQSDVTNLQGLVTPEQVQDWTAPMLTGGIQTGITFTYNDAANVIDTTVNFPSQILIEGQDEGIPVLNPVAAINFVGA